ncbi:DUF3301 domain-containing protein [Candidatus Thalassolituus haligoni]|uniref:DUF3301 domain-containing protein n=1 Tax=Candidatus Thalassolituus haligoni TaxID=3100113 RepID=UPI003517EBF8|tara:strand:+ start:1728 stop:2042 length:315 start_codon:yes stop_codon:yes gene_type:complete
MVTLDSLVILLLLAVIWWGWSVQQKVRLVALKHARRRCQDEGVQLLDDTLVLERMKPAMGRGSLLIWQRCYGFEFSSTGEHRYSGTVQMRGLTLQAVEMAAYRT